MYITKKNKFSYFYKPVKGKDGLYSVHRIQINNATGQKKTKKNWKSNLTVSELENLLFKIERNIKL